VEVDDPQRWAANSATDVGRRWWRYMAEVMPTNPDLSPLSESLREVFYLA
jgi:L-rhamnose mutarotase